MKTLDHTGLSRYLNPRASGLIVFKGGGGGATQGEVVAAVADGTSAVNSNVDAGFAAVADTGDTIIGNQDTMIGNQDTLITGQSDIRNDIRNIPKTEVITQTVDTSGIEKNISDLEGTTTAGFNTMGERFDTVDSSIGTVQEGITSGFDTVNKSLTDVTTGQTDIRGDISDLSGNVSERFNTVDKTLDTGFAGVNKNVTDSFASQNENLTKMSSDILGGQTSLQEYLEGISERADTYYGGLAEGQTAIQGSLGGLQENFADYRKEYTDDISLANKTRADLANSVTGGFNQVKDDLSRGFDTTSRQNQQINANTEQTMQNQQDMSLTFGAAFKSVGAGIEAQTADQRMAKTDMLQRLSTIREVIVSQGANLDPALSMQYAKLADSFDDNGRLIQQSVDSKGNVTRRAFDGQNNLNLAVFNPSGGLIDRDQLNIDQLMNEMDNLGYQGASSSGLMGSTQPFASSAG